MEVGNKSNRSPLDRVLGRLDDLDEVNLGILVQRLARERKLLETVFDVIRDGVLVLDDKGFLTYSNQQGRTLVGLKDNNSEKINIRKVAPEIARALGMERAQDPSYPEVVMREMQITYPETRQLRLYAVPIERSDQKDEALNKAGLAVVMTDVTEELDDFNAKIESEKVSSIMDLAAGVAHELGNIFYVRTRHNFISRPCVPKCVWGNNAFIVE